MEKMDNTGISFCLTDTSGQTDQNSTGIMKQQEEVIKLILMIINHDFIKIVNYIQSTTTLEAFLDLDVRLTQASAVCSNPITTSQRYLKWLCYTLEMSGHGVPWFILSGLIIAGYFVFGEKWLWVYGVNLFLILVTDIIMVVPIKVFFKRPRPQTNQGVIPLSVSSIDAFAFPSGHASRCVAIAAYFCYMPPFHAWTHLWYVWALLVASSRVVLGRHHITDVLAGIIAGLVIFETVRVTCLLYP